MSERPNRVTVCVPATSANVGVGFDCLGIALDLFARFTFEPADELRVTGCEERFRGVDNLVWTTYLAACAELGCKMSRLAIDIDSPIPLSGGLGSSSACVVAGIIAAEELSGKGYDRAFALDLATRLEGHPDNVAPAILGGMTSSFVDGSGDTTSLRYDVADNLRFVALSPSYEVRTVDARQVLPREIPLPTAVWQMGRCVAVTHALGTGDCELLSRSCIDRLHEPYRAKLIPDYDRLRKTSLDAGAAAFVISGSGSTMLAICDGDEVAERVKAAAESAVGGLWTGILSASDKGAYVERA